MPAQEHAPQNAMTDPDEIARFQDRCSDRMRELLDQLAEAPGRPRSFPEIEDALGWPRRRIASVLGGVSHLRHTEFAGRRPYRFLDDRRSASGRWELWMDPSQARVWHALAVDLLERLRGIDVSALSDADKTLPVVDAAVRALLPDVHLAGPAFTVLAEDDHLPVLTALGEAAPGDVLVVATSGGTRAVFGELFATEACRRGLAGIVTDGFCRDLRGLRRIGLPVFARGTTPRSGTTVSRAPRQSTVAFGGIDVAPGDVVFGDDDGLLIAPADRIAAALDAAELIARSERAILAAQARGESLRDLTSHDAHVAALDRGEPSALAFRVDA